MAKAIALRSFDHNGKVTKGDDVSEKFDIITLRALRRSGLISLTGDDGIEAPKPKGPPVPTTGSLGKAPQPKASGKPIKAPKGGGKSAVSPAAPASLPPTLPESGHGELPPPLPVA